MKYISFLFFIFASFGLAPFGPTGDWIFTKWLPDGGIMLSPAKYHGIYVWHEGEDLIQISSEWMSGYRPGLDNKTRRLAFLSSGGSGETKKITVFDLETMQGITVASGNALGLPYWTPDGDLMFFDGELTQIIEPDGKNIESVSAGGYITIPTNRGRFWCDEMGKAHLFDNITKTELDIDFHAKASGFLFEPIISDDYEWIGFQESGGSIYIININELIPIEIGIGDRPSFVDFPFGILYFEMSDDGERITNSRLYFVPIFEGMPGDKMLIIESDPPGLIYTYADYSPQFGLLLVSDDGRVFIENIDILELIK